MRHYRGRILKQLIRQIRYILADNESATIYIECIVIACAICGIIEHNL